MIHTEMLIAHLLYNSILIILQFGLCLHNSLGDKEIVNFAHSPRLCTSIPLYGSSLMIFIAKHSVVGKHNAMELNKVLGILLTILKLSLLSAVINELVLVGVIASGFT